MGQKGEEGNAHASWVQGLAAKLCKGQQMCSSSGHTLTCQGSCPSLSSATLLSLRLQAPVTLNTTCCHLLLASSCCLRTPVTSFSRTGQSPQASLPSWQAAEE